MLASSTAASASSGRPISPDCNSATRARSSGSTARAGFTVASGRGIRMTVASSSRTIKSRILVTPIGARLLYRAVRFASSTYPAVALGHLGAGTKTTIGAKRYGSPDRNPDETGLKLLAPQVLRCRTDLSRGAFSTPHVLKPSTQRIEG